MSSVPTSLTRFCPLYPPRLPSTLDCRTLYRLHHFPRRLSSTGTTSRNFTSTERPEASVSRLGDVPLPTVGLKSFKSSTRGTSRSLTTGDLSPDGCPVSTSEPVVSVPPGSRLHSQLTGLEGTPNEGGLFRGSQGTGVIPLRQNQF